MPGIVGAAAGLGEAAAAFFLLACAIAAIYLIRAIAALLSDVHIGPITVPIHSWFEAIAQPVVAWLVGATNELWSDAIWWLHGIAYVATGLWDDMISVANHLAGQVDHLFSSSIPEATAHAKSQGAGYVNDQVAAINREIHAAVTDASKITTAAVAAEAVKEAQHVSTIHRQLVALSASDLVKAHTYTDRAKTAAEAYADAQRIAAEAYADQRIGAIAGTIPTAVPLPIVPPIAGVTTEATTIVAGITAVGVAVASLAREFESCAVTSCDGPNNLQGLLNGLLGLGGLAALGEFLNEAINHPAQAEAKYASVFGGLVTTGESLFDDLLAL